MDAYVILFIFFGLILILWVFRSIKKDIERGEKISHESEKVQKTLSQLLNEAVETIDELDSFGEYIIERIENKVKWAKSEVLDIEASPFKGNTEHLKTEKKVEKTAETKSYAGKEDYIEPSKDMQKDENKKTFKRRALQESG